MKNKKLYIAYGSNINLEQMARRCPTTDVVATGMLQNYRLQFNGVATIEPEKDAQTPVLIWTINPSDEKSLDVYEGYPSFYRKEMFELDIEGEQYEGMAYIMNGGLEHTPSQTYYNCILDGYTANGLDTSFLEEALERANEATIDEEPEENEQMTFE